MPSVYALYAASSPDRVRYVGVTKYDTPERRVKTHLSIAKRGVNMKPVHCWIRKHVETGDQIEYSILDVCVSWEDALLSEIRAIAEMKRLGHSLLNLTEGGEGSTGLVQSEITKAKRAAALRGRIISDETKSRISAGNSGKTRSDDAKKKMRNAKLGKRLTEEHKEKIGRSLVGRPVSVKTREKISSSQKGKSLSETHLANIRIAQQKRRERERRQKDQTDRSDEQVS